MKQPAPGSPKAQEAGCTCPIDANSRALDDGNGGHFYWVHDKCPLHQFVETGDKKEEPDVEDSGETITIPFIPHIPPPGTIEPYPQEFPPITVTYADGTDELEAPPPRQMRDRARRALEEEMEKTRRRLMKQGMY